MWNELTSNVGKLEKCRDTKYLLPGVCGTGIQTWLLIFFFFRNYEIDHEKIELFQVFLT